MQTEKTTEMLSVLEQYLKKEKTNEHFFLKGNIPANRLEVVKKLAEDVVSEDILAYFDYSIAGIRGIAFTENEIIDNQYIYWNVLHNNDEPSNRISYKEILEKEGVSLLPAWHHKYFPLRTVVKMVETWGKYEYGKDVKLPVFFLGWIAKLEQNYAHTKSLLHKRDDMLKAVREAISDKQVDLLQSNFDMEYSMKDDMYIYAKNAYHKIPRNRIWDDWFW